MLKTISSITNAIGALNFKRTWWMLRYGYRMNPYEVAVRAAK